MDKQYTTDAPLSGEPSAAAGGFGLIGAAVLALSGVSAVRVCVSLRACSDVCNCHSDPASQ